MNNLGLNMGQVKKANRILVLKYINQVGAVSRKDIANATGLTQAALTQICNEFLEEGILIETGEMIQSNQAGRKKVLLDINWTNRYVLGINIEPEDTVIVIADLSGQVVEKKKCKTNCEIEPEQYLKKIAGTCRQMRERHSDIADKIDSVSVGITGLVNKENGVSIHAYGIWNREVNVAQVFKKELNLDCFVENNVNAFAMAENIMGYGKNYDNLLVVKWGPGVGSAIIIDGEIYEGRHGKAAEIGHIIVEPNGIQCSCGRKGCLETKINYHALKQIADIDRGNFADAYKALCEADVINIFARTLVNSMTVLAPNRVVTCGPFFKHECVRNGLSDCCKSYEEAYDKSRILYTTLSDKEDYIGPVASYVYHSLME